MCPLVDNVENVQMSPASMKPTIGFGDVPRVLTEPAWPDTRPVTPYFDGETKRLIALICSL